MSRTRAYTYKEELINTITHAAGILLGVAAGYILLTKAYDSHDAWKIGSVLVYIFGMLLSYMISTFYHSCGEGAKKRLLQKFDHASIYVHIAGTYTPFTLITLRNEGIWGWLLFAFVWLATIAGVLFSFRKSGKHSYWETACYVLMGTSILVAFKPLIDALNRTGGMDALYWLVAGGISYIIGAFFYSLVRKKYMHTVFHLFVLGGSICHIIAIYIII